MSSATFLYPLKASEKRRFSDVFRGYKNVTLDIRERRQLVFVTLNGNLAVSGWVGLAYDR